jgi:hypothetical protein
VKGDAVAVHDRGRFTGFAVASGHGAAELEQVEVKLARSLQKAGGTDKAAPQTPGFFQGSRVSRLL